MITENLSTLKIHKLTQEQYNRELVSGNIDKNALYLTPDEPIDLSFYVTVEQLNEKADEIHTHTASDVGAVPRITSTANAIARYDGTAGEVKNSTILIEDVTNTKNSSLKAQVISIPAANGTKKMVYGYCTDQTDGTSFIGGLFDADATAFPYAEGLAIGGSSGNLLWKGVKVATASDIPSVPVKSVNGKTGAVSLSYTDIVGLQDTLTEMQEQIDEASSSADGAFDFDAYANAAGYSYSYDKSTMTETITYGGSTFATRTNTKGTNKWTVVTTCSSMGVNTTKIWTKTDSGWTAS